MSNRENRASEFERFVNALLTSHGVEIIEAPRHADPGYDFRVKNQAGVTAVIEVKLHQSLNIPITLWRRMFEQIEATRRVAGVRVGMIVTNARLSATMRRETPEAITIWDFDAISVLAAGDRTMAEWWERISQEGFIHRSEPLPAPEPVVVDFVSTEAGAGPHDDKLSKPQGADLCQRLKGIKAGKGKVATEFENACIDALKYLFEDDLINWSPQKSSKGSLHRYDVIARVSSQNDFWNSIIADHRARYVIFEFKNSGKLITQAEIYSTEKYLYPQAMRSTGIIISRKGANRNAIRVMHGAFREAGKLILSLNIDQMCEMLHMRDQGEDPAQLLSDVIEDMLVGLER